MPLQGLPGATQTLLDFVQLTRGFMRDFEELNRLVAGEESTDRQIAWAILDAIADFNGTPHLTTYSLDELLQNQQHHLLLRMTVCSLIESIGLLQTRNHINYSTGGTNVGVNDKTPLLMSWLKYFKAMTEQKKQRVKVALNISALLGSPSGIASDYTWVNAVYAAY